MTVMRSCRSFLYVPGDKPAMLAKATERGADAVIVDLEDAVAPDAKLQARSTTAAWLTNAPNDIDIWVRVNNHPDLLADDLAAVADADSLTGIYLPKVEDPSHLDLFDGAGNVAALIESGRGLMNLADIARHPRLTLLAAGEADLAADLGITPSLAELEFLPFRMQLVAASAAARIEPPTAPVSTNYSDPAAIEMSTRALAHMGFGSRAAIHPAQVAPINASFTPTQQEMEWASVIVAGATAAGGGVHTDATGKMVDEAVVRRARRIMGLTLTQ